MLHTQSDVPHRDIARPRWIDSAVAIRVAKIATFLFWLPCLAIDLYVFRSFGGDNQAYSAVFHDLFGEVLVFLAGWLVIGGLSALLFSRWGPLERRPGTGRRRGDSREAAAIGRDRRGVG